MNPTTKTSRQPVSRRPALIAPCEKFASEAELVSAAERLLLSRAKPEIGVEREFDCWHGIADLVVYRRASRSANNGQLAQISPRWGAALFALPYRRCFTDEWFAKTNLISPKHARIVLQSYAEAGYCEPLQVSGLWRKQYQPRAIANEICAIEAKLTDWRRALSQASRYLAFAHQAWVLLDHATTNAALSRIELFSALNVGLASLSTDFTLHVWHTPTRQEPKDAWRYWAANVLLAQALATPNGSDKSR